ncbi:hypothetical protein SGGMMB4_02896 [Sodalis glossinidius str. 'morsitans']|uniref:Uncharacterized protein n=1 Tax=Sodalis glossinidius (strain morsitans) TaxID=343509 RepID=Q2NTG5_SODGM|nr:hypothetical protein [Sodalis glossinidius]BAE74560.1 hypothetical protein SG1285 [Sodalis glossinidius str. 'morsitans']CRL45281.1 hypothetical protein SGGMMB4_02896 [Sodalis glossinidius str. 'morsitans']
MHKNSEALKMQLDREYNRLQKCFHDFNYLKQSLAMLDNTVGRDSDAARRTARLESLFPEGITQLEREAVQDLKALEKKFKQLVTRLKHDQANEKSTMGGGL